MQRTAVIAVVLIFTAGLCLAQPFTIEDFDSPEAFAEGGRARAAAGAAYEVVDDGQGGSAIAATFPGGGMVTISLEGEVDREEWDGCNGVAFRFRGDGSELWACIGLQGEGSNRQFSYSLYVPLADTEWHEVRAHFSEFSATDTPVYGLGEPGMLPISGIGAIVLGDRWSIHWNNASIPPHEFAIDDFRLISDAPEPSPTPPARPLDDVLRLMRDEQPVTIQCMGDSITAGTGLPDRDSQRYAVLLQQKLRERLGYDEIVCYSRAVGGSKTNHGRAWIGRDFDDVKPDLVTIAYGYNDKSGTYPADYYRFSMADYIDRIARVTAGQAAICPITTLPGDGPRFVMLDDYAQQVRDLCAEREDVQCIDLHTQIKAMGAAAWGAMLRDMAHPNVDGHEWLAEAIADWLVERVEALE